MDKLTMAHDWYMKHSESASFMYTEVEQAWQYAEAMQAKAEECVNKERPEVLCQVDWRQAPSDAAAYIKLSVWDIGAWINELGIQIEDAPSFGFTGNHIVERPQ